MHSFISKEFRKKLTVRVQRYGLWIFVNFIFSIIPFAIMYVRNFSRDTLFSNFLSFNFGLLVSSLYVLLVLLDSKIESVDKPLILIVGTFFWVLVIDSAYVLYPNIPNKNIAQFLSDNLKLISWVILAVTAFLSLLLNKPSIERSISEKIAIKGIEDSNAISKKFKSMSRELEMEGQL